MRTWQYSQLRRPSAEPRKKKRRNRRPMRYGGSKSHRPVYRLPFATRGENQFILHFGVVNDGDKTVNPDTESSQLLINGKPLKDWSFIIGNGIKSTYNTALPAGENLDFTYSMGRYFEKPGIYKIVWKGKGFEAPRLRFGCCRRNREVHEMLQDCWCYGHRWPLSLDRQ